MAKPKQAKENTDTKKQDKKLQTEENQVKIKETPETQTPPSRQAGANQPRHPQSLRYGSNRKSQDQRLSRRESFSSSSPFSIMQSFKSEMDRLFDDFGFGGFMSPVSRGFDEMLGNFSPQTDVFRRGGEIVVQTDLPGMTKDDISIEIQDEQIVIRGERRSDSERDEEGFYQSERSYGSFYRAIPLLDGIDTDQANATFENGVLEITMPVPEGRSGGRRLEINESGNKSEN